MQGDAEAQLALGRAYQSGEMGPADATLAFQWIERAAHQGNPEAESLLAFAYQRGEGVALSDERAIEWHKRAANHGVVPSKRALGQYLTRNPIDPRPMAGVNWLREAAEAGDREAQALLGEVFRKGIGRKTIPSSLGKAEKWLTAAAAHGYPEDQYNLANLYFSRENYARTLPPLQQAVDQNLPKAYVLLARMHREGLGLPADPVESVRLLRVSAGFDDPASLSDLGEALSAGTGVERDAEAGFALFERAAMKGYVEAQYHLALAYLDGIGVAQDKLRGHAWLRICTSQTFREAIKERGRRRADLTASELQDVKKIEREIASRLPSFTTVASARLRS